MEEKIKIYVPKSVNDILLKDMERFEIFKKDASLNKNEFYNTLIMNYYEQYQEGQSKLFNYIKETISSNIDCSNTLSSDVASMIVQYTDTNNFQLEERKLDVTLSMKPTSRSSATIDFIQNYYVKNMTLSAYFRNMFASYSLLPQDKRERIIFKNNFDLVEKAIEMDRKIYFTTTGNNNGHIGSPYMICNSKEELFNYLLTDYNSFPYSFRIGRIRNVEILNEPREFNERNMAIFEKMIKHGPQFSYDVKKDDEQIVVKLTDRGKRMYKSMYLHRPQYTKIDNDIYYFECSQQQAYQYFSRFGRHAIVIEPESLIEDLRKFYFSASRTYGKRSEERQDNDSKDNPVQSSDQ